MLPPAIDPSDSLEETVQTVSFFRFCLGRLPLHFGQLLPSHPVAKSLPLEMKVPTRNGRMIPSLFPSCLLPFGSLGFSLPISAFDETSR